MSKETINITIDKYTEFIKNSEKLNLITNIIKKEEYISTLVLKTILGFYEGVEGGVTHESVRN